MAQQPGQAMGIEFTSASTNADGAALQAAWLGASAARSLATGSSRRHMTITSCAADARRALYAVGKAMSLAELRKATGRDGMAIGSVLVKLQRRGLVRKVPPAGGGRRGCSYLWAGRVEPKARRMSA